MKEKYPQSFPRRITNRIIAIVLVTMLILAGWIFYHSVTGFSYQVNNHFQDMMEITNEETDMWLSAVEISAANIQDELHYNLGSPANVCATLVAEVRLNPYVNGAGVGFKPNYFPAAGTWFEPYARVESPDSISIKQIGSAEHNYLRAEWYTEVKPEGYWTNPYFDNEGAGTIVCTYSLPVTDLKGNAVGVLGTDLKLDWLNAQIQESNDKENTRGISRAYSDDPTYRIYSFIIGKNGEFIVHPDASRLLNKTFFDFAPQDDDGSYFKTGHEMIEGNSGNARIMIEGQSSFVFYAPLMSTGWSMCVVVPAKAAFLPGVISGLMILLFIIIAVLIIAIVCRLSIHSATKPLVKLASSAEEIAKGNFDAPLPASRYNDEIGLLRDSFGDMQKSLSEYVDKLTAATAQRASMESELAIANDIQMSMLPKTFPNRPDVEVFASLTPAKAVGGDLYDYYIRDNMLFFCIGDVSGKGVPASLVMSSVITQFRALSSQQTQPDLIISGLNTAITERNESMMFVTFFAGMINLSTGAFHFCNAGHNVPVLITRSGIKELDVESNIPLGVDGEWRYLRQNKVVEPGTTIVLYTDGLTEAENMEHELFGQERMFSTLGETRSDRPREIAGNLVKAIHSFIDGAEQSDDLTMLIIHYKG